MLGIGWRQTDLPAKFEPFVAVRADQVNFSIIRAVHHFKRHMETIGVTTGRTGIYLPFRA